MKQQYKDAMSEIKMQGPNVNKWSKLPAARDAVVLWGIYQGWSASNIGGKIERTSVTAQNMMSGFFIEPSLIFRSPVLHATYRGQKRMFTCAFCSRDMMDTSERKAREHVAGHICTTEMIKSGGVF